MNKILVSYNELKRKKKDIEFMLERCIWRVDDEFEFFYFFGES